MAHYCICAICGEKFDRDKIQAVKHGARRYSHQKCEPDGEIVPLPQVDENLQKLNDYIAHLFGSNGNYALIKKQIKTLTEENGYSYASILKTLTYFFEVKGNSVEKSNGGIGIVPFVYQDAYNYYKSLWEAQQKNISVENINKERKIITIKEPQSRMRKRLFNLDDEEENSNEE